MPAGQAHHGKDECSAGEFDPSSHFGDDCMEQAKINVLKAKGLGERRNFMLRLEGHGRFRVSTACRLDKLRSFGFVEDDEVSE